MPLAHTHGTADAAPPPAAQGGLFDEPEPEPSPDPAAPSCRRRCSALLEDAAVEEGRPRASSRRRSSSPSTASRCAGIDIDTELASYLLDANRSEPELDAIALELLTYRACALEVDRRQGRQVDLARRGRAGDAADVGRRARRPGRARSRRSSRSRCSAAALTPVYETLERPLIPVLVALERAGVRVDTGVLAGQAARLEAELDERAERIYGIAGERFNINSPKQLGDVLFVKLQLPVAQAHRRREDAVDGAGRARRAGADARSAARGDRLARPAEAEGHVSRRAAVAGASDDRPRPHAVQPDDGGDGPALEPRSEPAERPDPHRAGARDPPRLHRRARLAADLGRLLADRAARAGAPLRRSEPVGSVPPERGHPRSHRAQGVRREQRPRRRTSCGGAPRSSTTRCSTGRRRSRCRATSASRPKRPRSSSPPTSPASPPSAPSSTAPSPKPRRRATSRRSTAAGEACRTS